MVSRTNTTNILFRQPGDAVEVHFADHHVFGRRYGKEDHVGNIIDRKEFLAGNVAIAPVIAVDRAGIDVRNLDAVFEHLVSQAAVDSPSAELGSAIQRRTGIRPLTGHGDQRENMPALSRLHNLQRFAGAKENAPHIGVDHFVKDIQLRNG